MPSGQSQSHIIKVKIVVRKLQLKVRFPCSVTFQLKHQLHSSQTSSSYPLTDNTANINDSLQLQIQAEFNSLLNKYQSKKVSLIVYMISSNGKVIAGSVKFDPFEKPLGMTNEVSVGLEKCPDKNARVMFSQCAELVSSSGNSRRFEKSGYSYIYELKHLSPRNNTSSRNGIDSPSKTAIVNPRRRQQYQPQQLTKSPLTSTLNNVRSYGTLSQRFPPTSYQRDNLFSHHNPTQDKKFHLSQIQSQTMYRQHPTFESSPGRNNSNKVNGSCYNNTKQKKNIQRVKNQLSFRHKQQLTTYQNRLQQFKATIQSLTAQLQSMKQKVRSSQKKEKNSIVMVNQLKQQIEKRKVKEAQSSAKITQLQQTIIQKQKQIKSLLAQTKSLQQTIDSSQLSNRTQHRKLQIKLSSLTQQLQKLQQKYRQSQKSRNLSVQQYNNLLNQLQQAQKKQQQTLKDNQKLGNDQRLKLTKRIELLGVKVNELNRRIEQQQQTIRQGELQKKALTKHINAKELCAIALQSQKQQLTIAIQKHLNTIQSLQQQVQLLKSIEHQSSQVKKRVIEVTHELSKCKQHSSKLQSQLIQRTNKLTQLQSKVRALSNDKTSLLSNQSALKRQLQSSSNNIKKSAKQLQQLSTHIQQLTKQNNEFRAKLQASANYLQQMRIQYQDKLTQVMRQKSVLESEVQQYKWFLQKQKQHTANLQLKHSSTNEDILSLNQQLIQKQQHLTKLQQLLTDNRYTIQQSKNHQTLLQKKLKQSSTIIKQKQQQYYEIKKRLQQSQQQLYLTKDKLGHLQVSLKDKAQRHEKVTKEKQLVIDSKLTQLQKMELRLRASVEDGERVRQELGVVKKEVEHWRFIYDQLNVQHQSTQQKLLQSKKQKQQLQQKTSQLQSILRQRDSSVDKLQKEIKKVTEEFQNYKGALLQSMEMLMGYLVGQQEEGFGGNSVSGRGNGIGASSNNVVLSSNINGNINTISSNINTNTSLSSFSLKNLFDPKISKLQIQLIQKHSTTLLKHRSRIFQLQQSLQLSQLQTQKWRSLYQSSQQQRSTSITKQKQFRKQQQSQFKRQQQQYLQQIKTIEQRLYQKLGQIQKLSIQIKRQQQISQQQNVQIHILVNQYQGVKQQSNQLEIKLLQLKQQQVKTNTLNDMKINQLSGHYEEIIERLRAELYNKEHELMEVEKQLQARLEVIKKLQGVVGNEKFEKDKLLQLSQELRQKLQSIVTVKDQALRRVKEEQKQSKRLMEQLNQVNQRLQLEKVKREDISIKNRKLDEELMEVQVSYQKIKIELQSINDKNIELQALLKEKGVTTSLQSSKQLQQIKSLRQMVISLKSQLDLKSFYLKQNQDQLTSTKSQYSNLQHQLSKRQQQLQDCHNIIAEYKQSLQQLHNKLNKLHNQKNQLEMQLITKNNVIENLNSVSNRRHYLQEQLQKRNRDLARLRQEKSSLLSQKEKQLSKLKSQLKQLKGENQRWKSTQQQYKRKLRQYQYLLQQKNIDLYQQKRKWSLSSERQKQQIFKRIQLIQKGRDQLQEQYRFQKQQLHNQLQSTTLQYNQLVDNVKALHQQKLLLEQQLMSLTGTNSQLKSVVNKLSGQSIKQHEEVLQLQASVKRLKERLQQKETQKEAVNRKVLKGIQGVKLMIGQQKVGSGQQYRDKLQAVLAKVRELEREVKV